MEKGQNNMSVAKQKAAAQHFADTWAGKGDEKQDTQAFWNALLRDVYGVAKPEEFINYEVRVKLDHTSYIDAFIPSTHVLIEQKGKDIDLKKGYKQSDGSFLTPFQQARRYGSYLPHNENPRWIVVSNFQTFEIHDMNRPNDDPEIIRLEDLPIQPHRMEFLVKTGNENLQKELEVSIEAGRLVGILYDEFYKQYIHPDDPRSQHSLNVLCVRLVFCLYAEDAGLFGHHGMFHDYMAAAAKKGPDDARDALVKLFRVLNQKESERSPYLPATLAAFPYVNGGLFADEDIEIPFFNQEIIDALLAKASDGFNWSDISPTIFGAVFESTLNPETRRSGGMHYTSIENIHKVIDPLFLDDLRQELADIKVIQVERTRRQKLQAFQRKLAGLTFLDPAAGSGNFLTETYISLRRMENEVLDMLQHGQVELGDENYSPVMVSINQFYGIEINDFAVTVAKTALWIAESQMLEETKKIVYTNIDFLPLTTNANIVEGNALRFDWESVVPKNKLSYIMGNPPFVGASMMTKTQKDEAVAVFGKGKRINSIDYVGAWYHKTAILMQGTSARAAFVSTNSITQGEQVSPLWGKLLSEYNVHIDFAHRTFEWNSEAKERAAVHCVIIGFSTTTAPIRKWIYNRNQPPQEANNINPYLIDAPNVVVSSRGSALCNVPRITKGNQPSDGGNLILSETERNILLANDPTVADCVRRYVGSKDFINNDEIRYCLWLKSVSPGVYRKNAEIMRRLEAVRKMRLASSAAPTRALAEKPYLFFSTPQTDNNYLCIPEVSSERRRYIPIGFMDKSIIASNKLLIVPEATLYHFGVLTSNVHMAWMRTVAGRLKSDYQYSGATVYNTFPWPTPTAGQRNKIEQTAQAILDARSLYPNCNLADLYDANAMPPELRKAHQDNDRAVMEAYGFDVKTTTEASCVAELMKLYQKLVEGT